MAEELVAQQADVAADDVPIASTLATTPAIYIDGAQGFLGLNGTIKISLYQVVQDFPSDKREAGQADLRRLVVGRLIMSPLVAHQLATWLLARLEDVAALPQADEPKDGKKG